MLRFPPLVERVWSGAARAVRAARSRPAVVFALAAVLGWLVSPLVFPPLPKKRRDREADAFRSVLERLATDVAGFRRSVEYVQDYIDIAGLKMWQEELARVVDYNVERECNRARRGRNRTRTGSPRTRARLSGRGTDPIRGHLARRGESPARESGDASRERPRDERVKRARNRESPIPTQASCAAR